MEIVKNYELCNTAAIIKGYIRAFKEAYGGIDKDYEEELNELHDKLLEQAKIEAKKEQERR